MKPAFLQKSGLFIVLFILMGFWSRAQLLTESFDNPAFPPTNWTNVQVGGGTDIWARVTSTTQTVPNFIAPHSGAGMAQYDSYNFPVGERANLVTPALNFSTGGPYLVKFWMYRDSRYTGLYFDSLVVYVNTSATSTGATRLGAVNRLYNRTPTEVTTGWFEYSFSIPTSFNGTGNYIIFQGNSDFGTEIVIDDISVETQPANCTGTPSAGTISNGSVTSICANVPINFTATGYTTTGFGIRYRWQYSTNGGTTWLNTTGVNPAALSISQTVPTSYRLVDTCTATGLFGVSNVITVGITTGCFADLPCDATTLVLNGPPDCQNTTSATSTGDPSSYACFTPNNTTWYKYTPATSGIVEFTLTVPALDALDGWLGCFVASSGTCPAGLVLADSTNTTLGTCQSFGATANSTTKFSAFLTAGRTYYFMVDGVAGAVGNYCISIQTPPPPPNCTTNAAPANGANNVSYLPNVNISWNASANADSYDIYLGTTNPPTDNIGNIAGTSANVTGIVGGTTYYWYVVPQNTGGTASGCVSSTTSFTTAQPPANCTPTYTTGCTIGDAITTFRLFGESASQISMTGATCASVNYYTDLSGTTNVNVVVGKSYAGTFTLEDSSDYISIWIDYNNNGSFETTERVLNNLQSTDFATPTPFSIYIPSGSALGAHKMRVRSVYYSFSPTLSTDPCGSYSYGETRDFTITIQSGTGSAYLVSSMTGGACRNLASTTIDAFSNNNTSTVPILDTLGNLVGRLNANGNNLGRVNSSIYINNSGTVRSDGNGLKYLDRNFTITPDAQPTSGNVLVSLYFTNAEYQALRLADPSITSVSVLNATKTPQACSAAISNTGSNVVIGQTGSGSAGSDYFINIAVPTFSSFYIHGGNNPVAVNLISFEVLRTGKINQLNWSTSQELNTASFIIEKSTDGRNFSSIGTLAATGNSNTQRNYGFTDFHPAPGINYYRLRIVDRDNSYKFSWVRSVRNEGTADVTLFPNPASERLQVQIASDKTDKAVLSITDMSGKLLFTNTIYLAAGTNIAPVSMSRFQSGTYIMKVQLSEDLVVLKFNKL